MADPILLDTGPLGLLCHSSHGNPEVSAIRRWLKERERTGHVVCLPEIADYEVRREAAPAWLSGERRAPE